MSVRSRHPGNKHELRQNQFYSRFHRPLSNIHYNLRRMNNFQNLDSRKPQSHCYCY